MSANSANQWKFPLHSEQYETFNDANAHHVHSLARPNDCTVYCSRRTNPTEVLLVNSLVGIASVLVVALVLVNIARAVGNLF